MTNAYQSAQHAMSDLKAAVHKSLEDSLGEGRSSAEIATALRMGTGRDDHERNILHNLLVIMESEGVVEQDPETKRWKLWRRDSGV